MSFLFLFKKKNVNIRGEFWKKKINITYNSKGITSIVCERWLSYQFNQVVFFTLHCNTIRFLIFFKFCHWLIRTRHWLIFHIDTSILERRSHHHYFTIKWVGVNKDVIGYEEWKTLKQSSKMKRIWSIYH